MEQKTNNTENQNAIDEQLVIFQKALKTLREMLLIQCDNGNWNYDPYMHGMANGMILALSLLEDNEPKYLDAPEVWLCDLPDPNEAVACVGDS
jgi:hypothetical protein